MRYLDIVESNKPRDTKSQAINRDLSIAFYEAERDLHRPNIKLTQLDANLCMSSSQCLARPKTPSDQSHLPDRSPLVYGHFKEP